MAVGIKNTLCALLLAASSIGLVAPALAQETTNEEEGVPTIPEALLDAFYTRGGNFYQNRDFPRSFTWFLGPFPENDIAADGRAVSRFYQQYLIWQAQSEPVVRTPDLASPFESSLLVAPIYEEEAVPASVAPPTFILPPQALPPAPPPAQPSRPVPALY